MKNKILLTLTLTFTCLLSNAEQSTNTIEMTSEQIHPLEIDTVTNQKIRCDYHLAAVAGVGVANWLKENDAASLDNRYTANFYAGALFDFQFSNGWQAETGLTLQHKGYRKENTGLENYEKMHCRLLYLEVPLLVGYEIPISQVHLTPQFGPYLAFAVLGKNVGYKTNSSIDKSGNYTYTRKWENVDIFDNKDGNKRYRRFDCGLHFGASLRIFENIRLGLGYEFGFVNVRRKDTKGNTYKTLNSDFSFHFAYYFF